jgi:IS5 family transposase
MHQPGFFDLARRYDSLDAKPDPLLAINRSVPWDSFRDRLRAALEQAGQRKTAEARKSAAGRKPWDEVLMFKVMVLQSLYNLSDDAAEYQISDRLSFMRFLGLGMGEAVPDAKTVWLYREALATAGVVETLFADFDKYLKDKGYLAMGGQIVDATIVPVPVNHNKESENEAIKAGEVPGGWAENPAKLRQKDRDARWTKKHGKSYYGYKDHVCVDRRHKLIRCYSVTDAARHDSQEFEAVLDATNTARDVWADSAYRSEATEAKLKELRYRSRIHKKGRRNKKLTKREQATNKTASKARSRVEHVFGHFVSSMGGKLVRTIGMVRAKAKIGLRNLTYNMQRFTFLEGAQDRPA